MPRLALVVLVLAAAACGGGRRSRAERWFAERGAAAATWFTCAQLGATLRWTCGEDRACQANVTEAVTMPCYVARYRAPSPAGTFPAALSPCFWARDADPAAAVSPAQYAREACTLIVAHLELRPHCEAEVLMLIRDVCRRGSPALTGAGP